MSAAGQMETYLGLKGIEKVSRFSTQPPEEVRNPTLKSNTWSVGLTMIKITSYEKRCERNSDIPMKGHLPLYYVNTPEHSQAFKMWTLPAMKIF